MARKQQAAEIGAEPSREEIEAAIANDENLEILYTAVAALSESGNDYSVFVYQMPRGGARREWDYLYRTALAGFDLGATLDALRDEHGGGTFRIQIRNANGRVMKNVEISIAPKKEIAMTAPREKDDTRAVIEAMSESKSDMMALVTLMMNQQQQAAQQAMQQSQLMVQMMQQSSQTMMQTLTALMSANRAPDPAQMISSLAATMQALKPEVSPANVSIKEQLETLGMLKELAGDGGGESSTLGNIAGIASAFAPALTAALASDKQAAPRSPNVPRAPALPSPVANPATQPPTDPMILVLLQIQNAAARNLEPTPYAQLLLDQLSDEQIAQVAQTLEAPDWHGQLCQLLPPAASLPVEWLSRLRDAILAELSDDDGAVPEAPAPQ